MRYFSAKPVALWAPSSPSGAASKAASVVAHRLDLGRSFPDVIAFGAFLKTTVTVIRGAQAWVSHDTGNLDSPEAIAAFERTVAAMVAETGVKPVCVAHDLHPDFYSTHYARKMADAWKVPTVAVQHHHAHMGAVLGEHQHDQDCTVYGLALDGFGLGLNNASWGGELLAVNPRTATWERRGGLALLAQPGGDTAARQPWRMAAAALHRLGMGVAIAPRFGALPEAGGPVGVSLLTQMMDKGLKSPLTSSCGRLFDAACGLLGVLPVARFEGEAPMALEALAAEVEQVPDGWVPSGPLWRVLEDGTLDCDALLRRLVEISRPAASGAAIPREIQQQGAWLFHHVLAEALVDWVMAQRPAAGSVVPLGGGCFFNRVLTQAVVAGLGAQGLQPVLPRQLSAGDPAISFGQAWCAAAQWEAYRG